jgi:hypothetical protein
VSGLFLGGELRPAGMSIDFLRQPLAAVRAELVAWRVGLGQALEVRERDFPRCVDALDPYEMPWTTEVLIDCGEWCAYMNNAIGGGDSTASASYLGDALGCQLVQATHVPPYPPGHAQTQLSLQTAGEYTLTRSLVAHAEDGRWSWHAQGRPLPFETLERYTAPRIRDRLDRPLLVEYLGALGIRVDDPEFYGSAVVVRQNVTFPQQRRETGAETLAARGW